MELLFQTISHVEVVFELLGKMMVELIFRVQNDHTVIEGESYRMMMMMKVKFELF